MSNWELRYTARRQSGSPATETSMMSSGSTQDFTQTADARFTIECLDILLADETITKISLTAVDRPEPVPFNRDNGVAIPPDDLQVSYQ